MLKKLLSIVAAVTMTLAGYGLVLAKDTNVTIGSGAINGVYYPTAGAIAKILYINNGSHHVRVNVLYGKGSKDNLHAVASNDMDFGIIQADTQYFAYNGQGLWEGRPVTKLRAVFALAPEAVTFVAAEDSGIKGIKDVKGKIIGLGRPISCTRINAKDVFRSIGLVPGTDFRDEDLKPEKALLAFREKRIDGFFHTSAHPHGNIKEATSDKRKARIIPIEGVNDLLKSSPYYTMTTIDMSQYPGAVNAQEEVNTLAVPATLVTTADIPDAVVYTIVKEVMENFEIFKSIHPALNNLTKKGMIEGLTAPIHSGALKYYREAGLIK